MFALAPLYVILKLYSHCFLHFGLDSPILASSQSNQLGIFLSLTSQSDSSPHFWHWGRSSQFDITFIMVESGPAKILKCSIKG